ncbi:T9SS type A sorting domain-containing protein, partial [bacterium]|nr:T9SS type A sorting domain-containing protein [bacterium]
NYSTTTNQTASGCDSVEVNGNWYYASQTVTDDLQTSNGCDSTVITEVTVYYSATTNQTASGCDSVEVNGNWYYASQTVTDEFQTSNGCDSTVITELTINYSTTTNQTASGCDSVEVNGNWYYTSQTVTDEFQTSNGCDSTVITEVTVYYSATTNQSVEECDSALINGNWYYTSQTVTDEFQTSNGCDSLVITELTINNSVTTNQTASGCDSVEVNGNWYYTSQTVTDEFSTSKGCDSTVITEVTIYNSVTTNQSVEECDSALINGNWYYASQTVTDVLSTSNGCDSTVITELTVNYSATTNQTASGCDSVEVNSNWYYTSQTVTDEFQTSNGCDSTVITEVTVYYSVTTNQSVEECDSALINGNWYYASQTVTDEFQTSNGCDSLVITELTINNSVTTNQTASGCDSVEVNGNWYYTSQTVTDEFSTSNGCDSTVITEVTVYNSVTTNQSVEECDSALINGNWYYASQTVTDVLSTSNGCDSTVITELTINNSVTVNQTASGCDSAMVNGNWYYSSQTVTDEFQTINGCDSTVITTLTITTSATVEAGNDISVCADEVVVTLDGSIGGGASSATWTGGNGSFNPSNTTLDAVYTPSAAEIAAGYVVLTLTTDNPQGDCQAVSDSMTIFINALPTVTLDSFDYACSTDDTLYLSGASPAGGYFSGYAVDSTNGIFFPDSAGVGYHMITYTYVDSNGCTSSDSQLIEVKACGAAYCSYTPGFWGNSNGTVGCGTETTGEVLSDILNGDSVVLGEYAESCTNKWRSFTLYHKDTNNIFSFLPAGGQANPLTPVTTSCTGNAWETMYNSKFVGTTITPAVSKNVLIGHTMALSFNVKHDTALGHLVIVGDTLHTAESQDCGANRNIPVGNTDLFAIPTSIREYFGGSYTVQDLLDLANQYLSGRYTPSGSDPSKSDITSALTAINEGFDECRVLVDQTIVPSTTNKVTASIDNLDNDIEPTLNAYPNPFSDHIDLDLYTPEGGVATVTIVDAVGKTVSMTTHKMYTGTNNFTLTAHDLPAGVYVVNVEINGVFMRVKMLKAHH